jgi:hypothetical protein
MKACGQPELLDRQYIPFTVFGCFTALPVLYIYAANTFYRAASLLLALCYILA